MRVWQHLFSLSLWWISCLRSKDKLSRCRRSLKFIATGLNREHVSGGTDGLSVKFHLQLICLLAKLNMWKSTNVPKTILKDFTEQLNFNCQNLFWHNLSCAFDILLKKRLFTMLLMVGNPWSWIWWNKTTHTIDFLTQKSNQHCWTEKVHLCSLFCVTFSNELFNYFMAETKFNVIKCSLKAEEKH